MPVFPYNGISWNKEETGMNRKRSLGLMKIACAITFVLGIVLFGAVAPKVVGTYGYVLDGRGNTGYYADLVYVELVGALCFLSLWEAWKICREIGKDNSFSRKNAKSLRRIAKYMTAAYVMMAIGLLACMIFNDSMVLMGLAALGTCIALIFALFAAAMAQLIEAGAALKDENDLTI